jgi:hypothetical protein
VLRPGRPRRLGVAEDLAWEDDRALRRRLEVHIPAGLVKDRGKHLRQFPRAALVGFKIQRGPDAGLVRRGPTGPVPTDFPDGEIQVGQGGADARALRDEGALQHDDLLPSAVDADLFDVLFHSLILV